MQVQDTALANFCSTSTLSHAESIERIRRIVLSEEVQRAVRCDNEPVCIAYLDTIHTIIMRCEDPRKLVNTLRYLLDHSLLNKILGTRQSRLTTWYPPRWPPETA
jgi:hypothetical protein